jgi:hypothetical protein
MLGRCGLVGAVGVLVLSCGDSGSGPGSDNDGQRLAGQFERLADSVDGGGYSATADALRHAAEIVRLTGHATPVALTVDGTARSFLAVAEQIDFPNLECTWPADTGWAEPPETVMVDPGEIVAGSSLPGDTLVPPPQPAEPPECKVVGTYSMRTLIAWEPERMSEVVRIVADVGSNAVAAGVPDVMTGLPSRTVVVDPAVKSAPPDTAPGGGGGASYPGFMGEYLLRDVGSWWAIEGNQTNDIEGMTGPCTDARARFDWAEFSCEAARFRFSLDMRVEPLRYDPLTGVPDPLGGPEGSHTIVLGSSSIDGVRLEVVAWTPPPLPPEPGSGSGLSAIRE